MTSTTATDTLQHAVVQGVAHEGITVHTRDGRRARLAVIDDDGNILEEGRAVERVVFQASREVIYNLWKGQGHMRVFYGEQKS
jgi:hypothetical protein